MQNFDHGNVLYLEEEDIDENGNLVLPGKVIVMVQGNFCGYCTQAKPAYDTLATAYKNSGVTFATLQVDGTPSEKKANEKLKRGVKSGEIRGVPTFILYNNGKIVSIHRGGRDVQSLKKFIELN